MTAEEFDELQDELETMRSERFAARRLSQQLMDHPNCRDPDHPGCVVCNQDSDGDYGRMHAND